MSNFEDFASESGMGIRDWHEDDALLCHFAEFYKFVGPLIEEASSSGKEMLLDCFAIEDATVNAFAAIFENDTIAVNTGVFEILKHTAKALASQDVMRRYAPHDTSRNVTSKVAAADVRDGFVPPEMAFGREAMSNFANDIYRAAVLFVFLHEFAHIFNGHLEYIEEKTGHRLLPELKAEGVLGGSLYRETLEWDADCTAINWLLDWALDPRRSLHNGRTAWELPANNHLGSIEYALAVVTTAVSMVIFYFAENSGPFDAYKFGTHPHPRVRLFAVSAALLHVFAFRTGQDYRQDTFETTLVALESWFQSFPNADKELAENIDFWIAAHGLRLTQWNEAWAEMYDICNAHKRGGAVAPKAQEEHPAFPTGHVRG